jgi:hypothetical protein
MWMVQVLAPNHSQTDSEAFARRLVGLFQVETVLTSIKPYVDMLEVQRVAPRWGRGASVLWHKRVVGFMAF